jgi:hypothetical protein
MNIRAVILRSTLLGACGVMCLSGADFSVYRGIQFGSQLSAVAKRTGVAPGDFRLLHTRPALIQEIVWKPRAADLSDPIDDVVLHFINGELFRMTVTYNRYKVAGMTAEDMIDSISGVYGAFTRPKEVVPYHSIYGESAPVEARWADEQFSYNLIQTGDRESFAMVLYLKSLEAKAEAAIGEARRIEVLEASQEEIERGKQQGEKERQILDDARTTNKPKFRP